MMKSVSNLRKSPLPPSGLSLIALYYSKKVISSKTKRISLIRNKVSLMTGKRSCNKCYLILEESE